MSCNKEYSNNFISKRSSTRLFHAPGGPSQVGSLIFGGGGGDVPKPNKENLNTANKPIADFCNKPTEISANNESKINEESCSSSAHKSDAEKVREFTYEAGQPVPDKPVLMGVDEVNFITKMILDELLELYSTVLPPQAAKHTMKRMLEDAKCVPKMNVAPTQTHKLIAEQGDALVDIYYYSLNCMAKKGVNLSKIFELVHNANMAKRDPKTKKFIKRADGKIIKPKGWTAPDISAEIKRQLKNGAW
eukprot:UN02808